MSPILDKRLYEVLGFEVLPTKSGKEKNSIEYERKPSRMGLLALSGVALKVMEPTSPDLSASFWPTSGCGTCNKQ
jgi:hypothetical protein